MVPTQLVVDHSLAVECGGFDPDAFEKNRAIEDRRPAGSVDAEGARAKARKRDARRGCRRTVRNESSAGRQARDVRGKRARTQHECNHDEHNGGNPALLAQDSSDECGRDQQQPRPSHGRSIATAQGRN